jgi:hypothetical protein
MNVSMRCIEILHASPGSIGIGKYGLTRPKILMENGITD